MATSLPRLLVVDDDPMVLESVDQLFQDEYYITRANSGREAITFLENGQRFDAIILDIKMSDMDGLEAAAGISKIDPLVPIIFYTGYPGDYGENQIDGQYHPFDYVVKNERPMRLIRSVRNAVAISLARQSAGDLIEIARREYGMVGSSPSMVNIYQTIERIASRDNKIMILGPTGSGKGMVARAIHKRSRRKDKRLVVYRCNRRQPELVESELFGHKRGAFTGAVSDQVGKFEYADGGTVFLDEIGDLDLNTQAKLLHVLEEGEMERLGSPKTIRVDVRLVCATHRDLDELVKAKDFREDLYYRLHGVVINLPRLKDRSSDIPQLIDYFVEEYCLGYDNPLKVFEVPARQLMQEFDWPGNVRQLRDTIQALIDTTPSSYITEQNVANYLKTHSHDHASNSYHDQLSRAKIEIISSALNRCNHNISAAARQLGLDRSNLFKMIKSLGIDVVNNTTEY